MTISEIKSRLTLSEVLKHYNLKPDKNLRLHCPFHEDKTPSLQVYYKTHTCYCFSSNCKTNGHSMDVIDFIMHKESCGKGEAIQKAIALTGNITGEIETISIEPLPKPTISREQFLQNIFIYFKNAVHNSKPAQEYIKSRGLDYNKIEIGYHTGQSHHGTRKDPALIEQSVAYGLLSHHTRLSRTGDKCYVPFAKYCIAFALRNKASQITGFYFRSSINDNNAKHYYLRDSSGLYPDYPKEETQILIITESVIDAASLLQIKAVTERYSLLAAYGTNRLNAEMKTAIQELPQLKEIVFAFDNDEAGNKAALKYKEELHSLLPQVIFTKMLLPNKDINETLQAHSDENIFMNLLDERTTDFLTSTEKNKNDEQKKEGTKENISQSQTAVDVELQRHPEINPSIITHPSTLKTINPYKLLFTTSTAVYQIKGGVDKQLNKLQITIEIINELLQAGINKRRFKADLYDNKQVEKLSQEAADLLQLDKASIEKDLHELTDQLDSYREKEMQLNHEEMNPEPPEYVLTPTEKTEALQLAMDKNLIKTLQEKLTQTGIVGEEQNKVFLYVIAASHIQQNPLNALIQGSSGSGKTRLLKQIFACMPEETKKIYSRLSEKMLYNVPKYYFQNKLICFEDVDGLGEEAVYAWRELVSNGELISGVSYKDEKGNIGIKELIVYGPITSIACTTHGRIYTDNMNRLFLIAIDESMEQTKKITAYQAQEAANLIDRKEQQQIIKQLQNFVRLLQPYSVHNPHALRLALPEGIQDERRLYKLYLYFIDMITVLHQRQRSKTKDGKLIATKEDCQIAKDLMFDCIMLKMDELDGSLRQFFERLKDYIRKQNNDKYSFTQREIRQALGVSKTQLYRFITELTELEYLQEIRHSGNKGNAYQVRYWDDYKKVKGEVKRFLQEQINNLSATI